MVQLITQANDAATILQRTQRGRVARRTNRPAQGTGYVPEPRGTSPTTTIAASLVGVPTNVPVVVTAPATPAKPHSGAASPRSHPE